MCGIEPFIILSVAAFYFTIILGSKEPDQLVVDPVAFQVHLEQGGLVPMGGKPVGEFWLVVCLDAFNAAREGFRQMIDKHSRRIGTVFLKGLHIAPPGILTNGSIQEELLPNDPAVGKASPRNKLHIHLDALSGVIYRFVRLRDILQVVRMDCHEVLPFQETIEASRRTGIAALYEFDPEDNKVYAWIASRICLRSRSVCWFGRR